MDSLIGEISPCRTGGTSSAFMSVETIKKLDRRLYAIFPRSNRSKA